MPQFDRSPELFTAWSTQNLSSRKDPTAQALRHCCLTPLWHALADVPTSGLRGGVNSMISTHVLIRFDWFWRSVGSQQRDKTARLTWKRKNKAIFGLRSASLRLYWRFANRNFAHEGELKIMVSSMEPAGQFANLGVYVVEVFPLADSV